jgi:hypothetical protein
LLRVCEHNRRDIFGLASIFALFLEMASAPLNSLDRVDRERVAVRWWEVLRYHKAFFNEHCPPDDKQTQQDLCRQLLLANADLPRVAFLLAKDLSAEGAYDEARAKLHFVHEHKESSPYLRAKALLRLAADAQHRLNDKELAHSYRTKAKQLHEVRPGNPQNSIAKT